ncbi:MAG: MFS transporter [Marinobacter sp.]|nr:MFS transporter [Marinobacter sp.]
MADHSQFRLFGQRRFLPFFLTQFAGAFNDNLFKNTLLLLITYSTSGLFGLSASVVVNVAAFLFILPFFLFSGIAGQVADKYEKSGVIRWVKLVEILIMGVAAIGLWQGWYALLLLLLFLMGAQSAFFGPVKYAILPEVLTDDELVGGNALVGMGTFVSILLGTIAAGIIMGAEQAAHLAAAGVVIMAIAGYLSARRVPVTDPGATSMTVRLQPFRETWRLIRLARERHAVWLSILAISWFWFLGAAYLTQFPNFARINLLGDATVVTLLLALFTIGIAVGSMLCERLSSHRIELGIVPIGALGLSLLGLDLYLNMPAQPVPSDWLTMLNNAGYRRILLDLLGIGVAGGLFIVPLYAFIQHETPPHQRARIIAALNVLNALFMVVSAVLGIVVLGILNWDIPTFFLILSIMNLAVAGFVFQQVPEFFLRFVVWMLSHTLYRVKHQALEQIPEAGPVILVCNHVSYMDALVLAGAVRRPVRFVMDDRIFRIPILGLLFRLAKTIPIASEKRDPELLDKAYAAISAELQAGQVVCVFPEGRLTTDGEIATFRRGIEAMVERDQVPVVPLALQGLWGSFFSHDGGPALRHWPRRFWSRIGLVAGEPVAPEEVTAAGLEARVRELRGVIR